MSPLARRNFKLGKLRLYYSISSITLACLHNLDFIPIYNPLSLTLSLSET